MTERATITSPAISAMLGPLFTCGCGPPRGTSLLSLMGRCYGAARCADDDASLQEGEEHRRLLGEVLRHAVALTIGDRVPVVAYGLHGEVGRRSSPGPRR